ncbi:hypothetical protein ABKN59_005899 [Abortiporus biennis]
MDTNPGSSSGPFSNSLARGQACLSCRRRKMRCDGAKPVCGQCSKAGRPEDCEYTMNIQGLTRSQMLEENIALLEARIHELENPVQSSSVKLQPVPNLSQRQPTSSHDREGTLTPKAGSAAPNLNKDEIQRILDRFAPHVSHVGFFLHYPRFIRRVQRSETLTAQEQQLLDALVTTTYLLGCKFMKDPNFQGKEQDVLSGSLQKVSDSLFITTSSAPRNHETLYIIQAEVLLANYFFYMGRFLEGKYHCSAAVSLTLSCGLNLIRSPLSRNATSSTLISGVGQANALPQPTDPTEEGERINAFWTVYGLDKYWAVATESPSAINEDGPSATRIDTPWPLSIETYEQSQLPQWSSGTVSIFLQGTALSDDHGLSALEIHSKASALFYRTFWLISQHGQGSGGGDDGKFMNACHELETNIQNFINSLTLIEDSAGWITDNLVSSLLIRVALIQLYYAYQPPFSSDGAKNQVRVADTALRMALSLRAYQFPRFNPILPVLLRLIGKVYVTEVVKLKDLGTPKSDPHLTALVESLGRIIVIMRSFSTDCPLMLKQLTELEQLNQQ